MFQMQTGSVHDSILLWSSFYHKLILRKESHLGVTFCEVPSQLT